MVGTNILFQIKAERIVLNFPARLMELTLTCSCFSSGAWGQTVEFTAWLAR